MESNNKTQGDEPADQISKGDQFAQISLRMAVGYAESSQVESDHSENEALLTTIQITSKR
jgi:hypothetical protein